MKKVYVPAGAWYQEKKLELSFPENWEIMVCSISDRDELDNHQIKSAILNPIGKDCISSLARDKKTAAVVVEDITRPSYIGTICSFVIDELESGGIKRKNIKFIISTGGHRPLQRGDLLKKLGNFIVENYLIINHNPYDCLEDTGIKMHNIPVKINKFFLEADVRVAVGSVLPHSFAGFSGGAKLVIPGLCDIETLAKIHKLVLMGLGGKIGEGHESEFRKEIEKIVSEVGINFFIGYVPNSRREIAGIFAGDTVKAHRAGVTFAKTIYTIQIPDEIDVAVLNAYPKDTEFLQSEAVFTGFKTSMNKINENGTVLIISECSEGYGYHSLFSLGMRLHRRPSKKRFLSEKKLIFYSPNINEMLFYSNFWEGYSFFDKWDNVINFLRDNYPHSCKVVIFPTAPLQIGA